MEGKKGADTKKAGTALRVLRDWWILETGDVELGTFGNSVTESAATR